LPLGVNILTRNNIGQSLRKSVAEAANRPVAACHEIESLLGLAHIKCQDSEPPLIKNRNDLFDDRHVSADYCGS
jgi:hypothetical protein